MRIRLLLLGLGASLTVAGVWYGAAYLRQPEQVAVAPPPAATAPAQPLPPTPVPAPSDPQAQPNAPVEEAESSDTETALQKIIPRQSVGHAAGLHKAADPLRLNASAALVLEAGSGQVLYAKNHQAVLPMASLTKLMTALIVAEAMVPMDQMLTIAEEDVDHKLKSRSRLRVGTTLTRAEAIHLALMSSENRAAHALGRTHPGGLQPFVAAMNAKARQLGMANTVYADPTGLSDANRSTVEDLAKLVVATSRHGLLRAYSTAPGYLKAVGNRTLQYRNSNSLVRGGRWDIAMQKTGYIIEAGHCVAMRTTVAGRDLVMVLLDAPSNGRRNADAEKLRRWLGGTDRVDDAAAKPAPKARTAAVAQSRQALRRKPEQVSKAEVRKKPAAATTARASARDTRQAARKEGTADKRQRTEVARRSQRNKDKDEPDSRRDGARVAVTYPASKS